MISKSFFEHFHRHRSSWLKPAQNRTNRWSWKWQPLPESIANQYEVVDSSLSWLETHPWHLGRSWWWDHNREIFVGWKIKCFDSEESSSKRPNGSHLKSVHVGWIPFIVVGLKGILRDWLLDNLFSCGLTSWSSSPRATQTKGSVLETNKNKLES